MESGIDTKAILGELFMGALADPTIKEFAEQAVRRLTCKWCARGWPINEDGQHEMLGVIKPCEAHVAE